MRRAMGVVIALMMSVSGACESSGSSAARADVPRRQGLVVLDLRSGEQLWVRNASRGRTVSVAGVGARSVLAYDQRCTDASVGRGRLIAFDATTGERRWSRRQTSVANETGFWSGSSSVDVGAGGVVVTPGGRFGTRIAALDERTGRRRWSLENEPLLGVSARDVFTASSSDQGILVVHDRRTGGRRWAFPTVPTPAWTGTFDVVAADRRHVVVANGNYLVHIGDRPAGPTTFFVLDARSGRQAGTFVVADPTMQFSALVLAHGALVHGEGKAIVARDLTTGAVRWTRGFPEAGFVGGGVAPVLLHPTGSTDRVLVSENVAAAPRVVALDTRTGAVAWERPESFVAVGGPAVSAISERTGRLAGVATPTGTARWRSSVSRLVLGRYGGTAFGLAGGRLAISAVCDPG